MYSVNINFDEASQEWLKNKKRIGQGMYKYKCIGITKKNKPCFNSAECNGYCKLHKKQEINRLI